MAVYTKQILSGSTKGRPIAITATGSPGDALHTIQATSTAAFEEVYLYLTSNAGHEVTVTLERGSTATAGIETVKIQPYTGLNLVLPGLSMTGTDTIVRAFATATNDLVAAGYVNRIAT